MTDHAPLLSTKPLYPHVRGIALRARARRIVRVLGMALVATVAFSLIKNADAIDSVGAETTVVADNHQTYTDMPLSPVTIKAARATEARVAGAYRVRGTIAAPSQRFWIGGNSRHFVAEVKNGTSARAPDYTLDDLPLVEVPSVGHGDTLAVFVSGDGGWASLVREVSSHLAAQRISVIGLNSLKYFWTARTPERCAQDLERILTYYLARWQRSRVVVLGYSMGADVLPFMVNRLSPERQVQVRAMILLAPSDRATFEFHVRNWLRNPAGKETEPLLPEIERLHALNILCIGGTDERASLCPRLPDGMAHTETLPGDHHFAGDFRRVAEAILRYLQN
jgi:type IV secretory pathway VirJ component